MNESLTHFVIMTNIGAIINDKARLFNRGEYKLIFSNRLKTFLP